MLETEIHQQLFVFYGSNVFGQRSNHEWIENGRTAITLVERSTNEGYIAMHMT